MFSLEEHLVRKIEVEEKILLSEMERLQMFSFSFKDGERSVYDPPSSVWEGGDAAIKCPAALRDRTWHKLGCHLTAFPLFTSTVDECFLSFCCSFHWNLSQQQGFDSSPSDKTPWWSPTVFLPPPICWQMILALSTI